MYEEDFVRTGGGHGYSSRRPGETWDALMDFAQCLMRNCYPEGDHEFMRRVSMDDGYSRDGWSHPEHSFYRGQPRKANGQFKRMRYGHDCEAVKERIGAELAQSHDMEWLIEKAVKEAGEFVKAAADRDEYQMFREFAELCIVMKGVAEFIPADLEEQACEKALEYYTKKAESVRYSNPLLDAYSGMHRMSSRM
jgi:hypothetical protein